MELHVETENNTDAKLTNGKLLFSVT